MLNEHLKSKKLEIQIESFEKTFKNSIEITWDKIKLLSEDAKFLSPIKVEFNLKKLKNGIEVYGTVDTELELSCSRCLEKFNHKINGQFEAFYIKKEHMELNEKEELSDLENTIYYENSEIDLTERVIEAIILAVPDIPLCKNDCKGLCPICGENLNEHPDHNCEVEDIDPRFEKLKQLLDNNLD
ncbi:hypothetical protein OSSY52_10860 [Tepiditoga spiralis]|uniref:DNA-binding protein n=1 Tax=Tepiditoga spiralis TaxID=2108365 RepID=A0A7G1G4C8_9BACT|nr:DUF177 domain-containing protein [Tepiditoga spiralis]BBE30945.1 hypothetical protein OSSY52_10860 [Tepiditoga spiralis]